MTRADRQPSPDAEALIGHLVEYGELLELLAERPGLLVISADPLSGTSALLNAALTETESAQVTVDARPCLDALDLAMAIADASISVFARDALPSWLGTAPPGRSGLSLLRDLNLAGVEPDGLRDGNGDGLRRLAEAVALMVTLARGGGILAIDHLGLLLSALPAADARALLAELRGARQRHPGLDLVLVEHADGHASRALVDPDHPLFRAGEAMRLRRAEAERFTQDLAVGRAWTDLPATSIGAAAELAAGVPFLAWRTLELAPRNDENPASGVLEGWQRLCWTNEPSTACEWDLLRRVHPLAQPVVAAMAVGLGPHAATGNSKSINDALRRLRGLGLVWQPEERRWSLSNPLLHVWVRDHKPAWTRRGQPAA